MFTTINACDSLQIFPTVKKISFFVYTVTLYTGLWIEIYKGLFIFLVVSVIFLLTFPVF